ncbi:MAG TPA: MerR family transcriptional regulator [Phenylobacterium sp.]
MINAGRVQQLTGLSADQLREWTHRRALIAPDVPPRGPGHRALYAWQTVLLLRLAVVLKEKFRIELQGHRDLLDALRDLLAGVSFPALRGTVLVLHGMTHGELADGSVIFRSDTADDALLLRLDPHLDILAAEFAPREQSPQLPLFRAVRVR